MFDRLIDVLAMLLTAFMIFSIASYSNKDQIVSLISTTLKKEILKNQND